MNIKTFAAELADSSDIEVYTMCETITTARISSAQMKQTWKMLADMVEAASAELLKRGLKLPGQDNAGTFFDQSWDRAVNSRINNTHRLETA
jgi:hypothetical protein